MTIWILAVLALWVAQTMVAPAMRYLVAPSDRGAALWNALGPRDTPPAMPVLGERAARALANLHEALPVFLSLALLLEIRSIHDTWAVGGAAIFLVARILYVPAYLSGIPGLRSTVWMASWVGLSGMIGALVRS